MRGFPSRNFGVSSLTAPLAASRPRESPSPKPAGFAHIAPGTHYRNGAMTIISVEGFIDTHVHTGPAPFRRIGDSIDVARWCREAGMLGIVVKKPFRGDHHQGLPRPQGGAGSRPLCRDRAQPRGRRHQPGRGRAGARAGRQGGLDADHRRREPCPGVRRAGRVRGDRRGELRQRIQIRHRRHL